MFPEIVPVFLKLTNKTPRKLTLNFICLCISKNYIQNGNCNFISPTDILLQLREKRRGSSASGDFRHFYRGRHHNRHSRRRQTVHSHHGLLLPPGIPPAYPATGYRTVYSSSSNMADRQPLRQPEDAATWVNNTISTPLAWTWNLVQHVTINISDSGAAFSARLLICCLLY